MPQTPVAQTTTGSVAGARAGEVLRFLGIPYGSSTGGSNRFAPPRPPESWTGIREAVTLGARAPQIREPGAVETEPVSEDCLVLNVWTPALEGKRPVLVWMHEGAFFAGSGYNPYSDGQALSARGDVVLVSFNHRLGLLGFLDLTSVGGDSWGAESNVGILDIVAVLEWVRDNIGQFGGDPSNVTIFGHSGGGNKVATIMGVPQAKGLFHKASVHGGPPFGHRNRAQAHDAAELVLNRLGISPSHSASLQNVPLQEMLDIQVELGVGTTPGPNSSRFAPVIDTPTIPAYAQEALAAGFSSEIPMMVGTALDEMRFCILGNPQWLDPDFQLSGERLRRAVAAGIDNQEQVDPLIERYRTITPGASRLELMFDILSDQVRIRAQRLADAKQSGGDAPVFLYLCALNQSSPMRAFHSIEMPLFFRTVGCDPIFPVGKEFDDGADVLSDALLAFARSGEAGSSWGPYDHRQRNQLLVTADGSATVAQPHGERMTAWTGVIASERTDAWGGAFS